MDLQCLRGCVWYMMCGSSDRPMIEEQSRVGGASVVNNGQAVFHKAIVYSLEVVIFIFHCITH